jgi:hypothetical protein
MNLPTIDPTLPWPNRLQAYYDQLDAFIAAEEKDKTAKDFGAWASDVNKRMIEPIIALFIERYKDDMPIKIQTLDVNPKVKKDDHIKRLKALRYNIYTYQRKTYLEETGDL